MAQEAVGVDGGGHHHRPGTGDHREVAARGTTPVRTAAARA
ncbi:hypothetical protein ACJ6WD_01230 [Streptomyces sp. VTCC 41912]|nr:hypothetical protein [Streptomyces noursei]